MNDITWAESEHEYPNGAAWPHDQPTYPTIASARENSAYVFPEQAYLYCVQDGLVLGSCEVHVETVGRKYSVVTMHRIEAGRKYMLKSLTSDVFYGELLEYVILDHFARANEYIGDVS